MRPTKPEPNAHATNPSYPSAGCLWNAEGTGRGTRNCLGSRAGPTSPSVGVARQTNQRYHSLIFLRNRRGGKSFEPRRLFRVPETQWRSSVPSVFVTRVHFSMCSHRRFALLRPRCVAGCSWQSFLVRHCGVYFARRAHAGAALLEFVHDDQNLLQIIKDQGQQVAKSHARNGES